MRIFVDTNILLDVLTKREPFYEHSAIIWSLVEQGIIEGFIAAISVNNIFYISKKLRDLGYAQGLVDKILRDFQVIALDYGILKLARTMTDRDYEDLIQYFSAIRSGSKYLITRNIKDFPETGIEVMEPINFLQLFVGK